MRRCWLVVLASAGILLASMEVLAQVGTERGPMPMPGHFLPPPLPEDTAREWPCRDGKVRAEAGVDLAKAQKDGSTGALFVWGQRHLRFAGKRPACVDWDAIVSSWQRLTGVETTGVLSQGDLQRVADARAKTRPQFEAAMLAWSAAGRPAGADAPPYFAVTEDPAATVFGLKLGHPVSVPHCPAFLEAPPPGPRYVPQSCYSTFGSGDLMRPVPNGTMQIYFARAEHPAWMDYAGEFNSTGYAPSILADFRRKRIINLRFKSDAKMRHIAIEAMQRKWGPPQRLGQDERYAAWDLPAVEATASCPEPVDDPLLNPLGIIPPCTYTVWLKSAKVVVEQERRGQQERERERVLDSGRPM